MLNKQKIFTAVLKVINPNFVHKVKFIKPWCDPRIFWWSFRPPNPTGGGFCPRSRTGRSFHRWTTPHRKWSGNAHTTAFPALHTGSHHVSISRRSKSCLAKITTKTTLRATTATFHTQFLARWSQFQGICADVKVDITSIWTYLVMKTGSYRGTSGWWRFVSPSHYGRVAFRAIGGFPMPFLFSFTEIFLHTPTHVCTLRRSITERKR